MIRSAEMLFCAVLLATSLNCMGGTAWTVDYEFEVSGWRDENGTRVPLEASSRGRDLDLVADDDLVSFSCSVRPGVIELTIRNLGAESQKLIRGNLIDAQGRDHELFVGRNDKSAPPPLIPPGSEVAFFLWPQDWFRGELEGRPSTWAGDSPMDGSLIAERTREGAEELGRDYVGRSFELRVPLQQGEATIDYGFRFTVKETVPDRIPWS